MEIQIATGKQTSIIDMIGTFRLVTCTQLTTTSDKLLFIRSCSKLSFTCNMSGISLSLYDTETLVIIYVPFEGRVIYLIHLAQLIDAHFGGVFTVHHTSCVLLLYSGVLLVVKNETSTSDPMGSYNQ